MRIKVGILSYSSLTAEMKDLWDKLKKDMDIIVVDIFSLKDLVSEVIKFIEIDKPDILISSSFIASYLRQGIPTPIISFTINGFDLLKAIKNASKYSCEVVFLNFEKAIAELQEIQDLLKVSVSQDIYFDRDELERKIVAFEQRGIKAIIGSSQVCELAEKHNIKGILVYSHDSMRQAIANAHAIALSIKQEIQKAEYLNTILDYTYTGIIATDVEGKITVLNPVAEEILQISASEALHRPVKELIPVSRLADVIQSGKAELNQLNKVGDTHIITNRIPIKVHGEICGAVATFQDAKYIQKAEGKIRRDLNTKGLTTKFTFDDIIGESEVLLENKELAKEFALTDSTVLITGETGSGKELFAQSIHHYSSRSCKPFVAVNCAALPEALLESELFGYEEGAFTGALRGGKLGLFELAHGGTIFLDEISEIPLSFQSKLLRVLQEKEIMRVGSDKIIPVNVRVVAATNRDLLKNVNAKKMRDDLYYRINVLHIHTPPLRERRGDIPLLARKIIRELKPSLLVKVEPCMTVMFRDLDYRWPGNIRELQNVLERFVVMAKGLESFELPVIERLLRNCIGNEAIRLSVNTVYLDEITDRKQKHCRKDRVEEIVKIMKETSGNKTETARRLGVSRMTLWRHLRVVD